MATEKEKYYWLIGRHDDVRLECLEISHPSFSKTYRFVRNHTDGVRVRHENGRYYDYEYLPITIQAGKTSDNLEQAFTIGIGDVGEIMPFEIRRLRNGSHASTRPTVNYRVYLTSDLSEPLSSVLGLEITDNQPKKQGAVFVCKAKETNKTATGVKYTLEDYPTLRGFL
nr:DUF1833 family protein [uncultured Moraxella sp.]